MDGPRANVDGIAGEQLLNYITRIERLEEEKANLASDITDVYREAKGMGFDTKIMRQLIRLRKQEPDDRQEGEALLESYKLAIGMA